MNNIKLIWINLSLFLVKPNIDLHLNPDRRTDLAKPILFTGKLDKVEVYNRRILLLIFGKETRVEGK